MENPWFKPWFNIFWCLEYLVYITLTKPLVGNLEFLFLRETVEAMGLRYPNCTIHILHTHFMLGWLLGRFKTTKQISNTKKLYALCTQAFLYYRRFQSFSFWKHETQGFQGHLSKDQENLEKIHIYRSKVWFICNTYIKLTS